MTKQEFAALRIGDVIRHQHICGGDPMTIVQKESKFLTVAVFATASNPAEWEVWSKTTTYHPEQRDDPKLSTRLEEIDEP